MRNNRINDDDDFPEDFFPGTGDEGEGEAGYEDYVAREDVLAGLEIDRANFRKKILNQAIRMREKEWFWSFRSFQSKLMRISVTYQILLEMVTEYPSLYEEEEEIEMEAEE